MSEEVGFMEQLPDFPRRELLKMATAGSIGTALLSSSPAHGQAAEQKALSPDSPALPRIHLLAGLFCEWQMPVGRLDPERTPVATWGAKRNSYPRWVIGLNQAFRATGEERYQDAADRMAVFYLACLCNTADFHPPHFGLGMVMYRELKQNHPEVKDFDDKAAALFEWMKPFQWDEGSYYRNGYPGGDMLDAGNSCDNADAGNGLMAYHTIAQRRDVLSAAERLARYFVTEVKPGTYQGVWSSKLSTWVVAPTGQAEFEHFENAPSSEIAWGYTSIIAISYLTRLAAVTEDTALKARIAETCAASMKWQFDACQFDDGACGMSGRDDKWLGMTAGAILSYLRVRDAGYLSETESARYRPKTQAAADWLVGNITEDNLRTPSAGYFKVNGTSLPKPPDNVSWNLGYTLEALTRIHEI